MKIYSWNMLYRNMEETRAFAYISNLEFDVLCLQEVPEAFLPRLKTLPYHVVSTLDAVLTHGDKRLTMYHAILSRYPIRASHAFPMPGLKLPARSVFGLRLKEGWSDLAQREGLYADIETENGLVRAFSIHLAVLSPSARAKDLDAVAEYVPKEFPAIVAGDFNIVEHPLTKPFHWLFGASLAESSPWHDERGEVEERFAGWGLQNPLRGFVTLGISLSQLDHILVPSGARVLRAEVVRDTYGSDHHPISVEISA